MRASPMKTLGNLLLLASIAGLPSCVSVSDDPTGSTRNADAETEITSRRVRSSILIDFPGEQMQHYFEIDKDVLAEFQVRLDAASKAKAIANSIFKDWPDTRVKFIDGFPDRKALEDELNARIKKFNDRYARYMNNPDEREFFIEYIESEEGETPNFLLTSDVAQKLNANDRLSDISCVRFEWENGEIKAIYNYKLKTKPHHDPANYGLDLKSTTPTFCITAMFD